MGIFRSITTIFISISIYKAVKGLLWKVGSIINHAKPPDPLLPLQNPASTSSTEPLLVQTPSPISSPTTFPDEDLECGVDDFDRILWREEENYPVETDHHVVFRSLACAAVSVEENASRNASTSCISTEPLKVQTQLSPISSPSTFPDEDLECGVDDFDRIFWRQEENYPVETDHHVVFRSLARAAVFVEENASRNASTSCISTEPLKVQTQLSPISSPTTFDDEDLDRVFWRQEDNYSDHHVLVSVHQCSLDKKKKKKKKKKKRKENVNVVSEERWIKHYSSRHKILLVGEGDFSFSACLALAFVSAPNIIATSLDSQAFLKEHYLNDAVSNIEKLRSRGSKVMHGIDATKMSNHKLLGQVKFDRIIYNFPYAGLGGLKDLPRQSQLEYHRSLVRQFMENAREMISNKGEIHITHKTNGFHAEWRLESLAHDSGLRLIEAVKFDLLDYPGYNSMCGFGGNKCFQCYPSKTYKFGLQINY